MSVVGACNPFFIIVVKKYIILIILMFVNTQFSGIKYIHKVGWSPPPTIPTTFSASPIKTVPIKKWCPLPPSTPTTSPLVQTAIISYLMTTATYLGPHMHSRLLSINLPSSAFQQEWPSKDKCLHSLPLPLPFLPEQLRPKAIKWNKAQPTAQLEI